MSHLLTGRIEPRFFRDAHVDEGDVRPQLIVEGVPFPDFVRACLQVQGLASACGIVEGGPFRLSPSRIAERAAEYAPPASYAQRLPDRWNTHALYVCECGDAACYALFGSVLPYTHDGQPGLLIDKCWGRAPEPYPVPSIFIPDTAWAESTPPRHAVLPAEALQPTPHLAFLLSGDVHALLAAYERDLRDSLDQAAGPGEPVTAEEAFQALFSRAPQA